MLIALPKVFVKPNIDKKLQINRNKVKHLRYLVDLVARDKINAKVKQLIAERNQEYIGGKLRQMREQKKRANRNDHSV